GGGVRAQVAARALGRALTGGTTVNVQTSNAGVGGQGTITVDGPITATGAGTLNLIANSDITVGSAIASDGVNALNVGLYAGSNGTPATIATAGLQSGSVLIGSTGSITTTGGKVIMVGGTDSIVQLNGSVTTGGGDVSLKAVGSSFISIFKALNAGTGNVKLELINSQGGISQSGTGLITAANLDLTNNNRATTLNLSNNITSLSGSNGTLSLTNTGALALGALTVRGGLTLNTGGTVSQTGALTQTSGIVNVTATAGTVKLTNSANNVSGTVNLSAAAGGVAFVNNNATGISEGNITAATSINTTNAASIANFTASEAALTGVVLLQALQGDIFNSGGNKIVADRAVLVAANRIGGATATDATRGVRVEGAAGASAREVYVSAGATQMASVFGPTAGPTFYNGLMNGATALPSPASVAYNGVTLNPLNLNPAPAPAVAPALAPPVSAAAVTPVVAPAPSNSNDAVRQAQNIAQNQAPRLSRLEPRLNPVVTQGTEQANTQFGNDRRNDTRVEPITIPSCAPGAARPAAAEQC
ncbi:MAG: hypothetical protein H7197_07105, partial [Vitreoscilla sp.]|nr:hypothetical protein [Polaromonas sp.]